MNHRVLLIDDDPIIRKVVGLTLEKGGFKIKSVENGEKGLEILEKSDFNPECIILDIRMPKLSGIEVLKLIKKKYKLIPVIMLTALTDIEIAIDTMKNGAFDYILKPVRKVQLVETIKKAIKYREVLLENERLTRENLEYQRSLEKKVEERTKELLIAYRKLKETNLETVKVLAETIEAKDPYTRGHCNRVRVLSSNMASSIGLTKEEIENIEYGALLHDIGKIGIPEKLLHKNGPLTAEEAEEFHRHTIIGDNIIKNVEFFNKCRQIIRGHHEWYNGNGYPDRLSGEKIDISARIVAIADSFDAMTSTRPYRTARSLDFALNELEKGKGSQFDPELVDVFIKKEIYNTVIPEKSENFTTAINLNHLVIKSKSY